ncbi:hypothetical protein [Lentzea sp. NBRC 102530]|uniref:hypothetical protein n=1 Tax=Lentzea sp. NBRC 102530 TaxID=3032201 RepID=UPI0024A24380|nr:hypothetical protein [Lentzea sp. NBRC 102530]GLY50584.1 hypothetical protein Lesp01_42400 [Lentzea sp. NBRC 102530]
MRTPDPIDACAGVQVTSGNPSPCRSGETQIAPRQDPVKEGTAGVKVLSGGADLRVFLMHASRRQENLVEVGRERAMADLAYALLLIVSFLVLGLTVRGLEKL